MRCACCLTAFTLHDDIHVTEGNRPSYLHDSCVGKNIINRVIPAREQGVKNERSLHRRRDELEPKTQGRN